MSDPTLKKRQVAIFGGGFNPPHLAHLFTAQYLLSRDDVDEVWLLPAVRHAFEKRLASLEERVSMLEQTLLLDPRIKLCLIEAEPELSGFTYDTLAVLSARHPDVSFKLTIGADNLTASDRWHRFKELCERWQLIVMGRPGHEAALHAASEQGWCLPGPLMMDVSSSSIRDALMASTPPDWDRAPLIWLPMTIRERALSLYGSSSDGSHSDGSHSEEVSSKASNVQERSAAPPSASEVEVWVWGEGRCGRALTRGLERAGLSVDSTSFRAWSQRSHEDRSLTLSRASTAPVWVLACRDDDLERLSRGLSQELSDQPVIQARTLCSPIALHCSGARPPEVLNALSDHGFSIGKLHPLMTLRGDQRDTDALGRATYLVAGDEPAMETARSLIARLGGAVITAPETPRALTPAQRASLYHAAAALGANLTGASMLIGELIFLELGYSDEEARRALRPLYEAALRHQLDQVESRSTSLSTSPPRSSDQLTYHSYQTWRDHLTGPVSRGDVRTLQAHLEALQALEDARAPSAEHPLSQLGERGLSRIYQALSVTVARLIDQAEVVSALSDESSH